MKINVLNELISFLQEYFRFEFTISELGHDHYVIKPKDSNSESFVINTSIKDNTRLIIECDPDTYGSNFLELINRSDLKKRNTFCKVWEAIGYKYVKVFINSQDYTIEQFVNDTSKWQNFKIRFSKAPFFEDDDLMDMLENVCTFTKDVCCMIMALFDFSILGKEEGKEKITISKKCERDPINREICLKYKGYSCAVCGFNFEDKYGEIGKNFIHVHHLKPLYLNKEGYVVDAINDLVPICPNCHYMLHRQNPPYSVEELKEIIDRDY